MHPMPPGDFFAHHSLVYWALSSAIHALTIFAFLVILYWGMENMSEGAAAFCKGVLSDGGQPSWSRAAASVMLIACIVWDTLYLVKSGALVDGGTLSAQALFISSPYMINVTGKAVMQASLKPSAPTPPPAPTSTVNAEVNIKS